MNLIIKIVMGFLIVAILLLLITLFRKNSKIKENERKIEKSKQEFKELIDFAEESKDRLSIIGSLCSASDRLIGTKEEHEIYSEIIEEIKALMNPKAIVLYSFDIEKREFELVGSHPLGDNFPQSIKIGGNNIKEVYGKTEITVLLRDSKDKPLGLIRIFQKQIKLNKMLKEAVFTGDDFNLLSVYLNQVAMIMEKTKLYKIMERMALTDNLTKLYNRHYAFMRLKEEMNRAIREKYPVSIMFMDIDKFKKVNDTYGHEIGDLALQHIADIIKSNAREYDIAVRWGGEEFVMFLPNTPEAGAYILAERLRTKVLNGNFEHCPLTISLGVATYPGDDTDIEGVIKKADDALYFSKENGRNRTTIYSRIHDSGEDD